MRLGLRLKLRSTRNSLKFTIPKNMYALQFQGVSKVDARFSLRSIFDSLGGMFFRVTLIRK